MRQTYGLARHDIEAHATGVPVIVCLIAGFGRSAGACDRTSVVVDAQSTGDQAKMS
jgi:hypothetical protein